MIRPLSVKHTYDLCILLTINNYWINQISWHSAKCYVNNIHEQIYTVFVPTTEFCMYVHLAHNVTLSSMVLQKSSELVTIAEPYEYISVGTRCLEFHKLLWSLILTGCDSQKLE